jgi:ubiquitin C-terminal hydrolase
MKELKELKRIEEQNRLNDSLVRLNTKSHKTLHNKSVTSNNNTNHVNHSNGASSSNVNNHKNTTSTSQSTGNSNANSISQNNQKVHQSNGGNSKSGSSKSLTSENSLNSSSKNSHNYSPHQETNDDLNKINIVDALSSNNGSVADAAEKREELTWIHELFQGILVNETKCLNCETSSSKEENFLDLSVDVEQNTSISHCLQEFSNMEMLCGECKYYCENCCSKQEAEKR